MASEKVAELIKSIEVMTVLELSDLVKALEDSMDTGDTEHFNALIFNEDPVFTNSTDRYHLDFSLDTLSPAQDAGDPVLTGTFPFLEIDLTGQSRTVDGKPDLGAFERRE